MVSTWLWLLFFFLTLAVMKHEVDGDVTIIKAEIKHNNITIPNIEIKPDTNTTSKAKDEKKETQSQNDKSHRKSEIYVVNNGLLFLHPKKVDTAMGVKKSTEPIPPSINYHVIKKLKSNSSIADIASKILDSHLQKRSIARGEDKGWNSNRVESEEIRSYSKQKTPIHQEQSEVKKKGSWNMIQKDFHREGKDELDKTTIKNLLQKGKLKRSLLNFSKRKKTMIDNPLYDLDQPENAQSENDKLMMAKKRALKRKAKSSKEIPNIRKDFLKLEQIKQYPRFPIHSRESKEFPRFPIKRAPILEFPRFPVRARQETLFPRFSKAGNALLEFPRFPERETSGNIFPDFAKRNFGLLEFPRFPKPKPVVEFPKFQKNVEPIVEFPRFEKIKPLNLDSFPEYSKYPEATAIPEIKDIEDTDKRSSKSKRGNIVSGGIESKQGKFWKRGRRSKGGSMQKRDSDEDDDDDYDDDDDDGDYYDGEYLQEKDMNYDAFHRIGPIGSIPRIHRPPSIPSIPDIPSIPVLPVIAPLHPIKGIKSIPDVKSIPASTETGDARSLKSSQDNKAIVHDERVDVKSER